VSCLPGGLGRVSSRVGLHRHAIAACIVGLVVLLVGCSKPAPTVISVQCKFEPYGVRIAAHGKYPAMEWSYYEILYWSDGTKTYRGSIGEC
jgi:hypothetical protein